MGNFLNLGKKYRLRLFLVVPMIATLTGPTLLQSHVKTVQTMRESWHSIAERSIFLRESLFDVIAHRA